MTTCDFEKLSRAIFEFYFCFDFDLIFIISVNLVNHSHLNNAWVLG